MDDMKLRRLYLNQPHSVYKVFYTILKLNQFKVSLLYCMETKAGIMYGFIVKKSQKLNQIEMLKRIYYSCLSEFDDIEPSMSFTAAMFEDKNNTKQSKLKKVEVVEKVELKILHMNCKNYIKF